VFLLVRAVLRFVPNVTRFDHGSLNYKTIIMTIGQKFDLRVQFPDV
jgi:hypothetical protein